MFDHYPIHELIENQQKRLGLRRNELARRCGFKFSTRAFAGLTAFVMATLIYRRPKWCSTIPPPR